MADWLSPQELTSQPPVMSDDHSELAPLLPIPNRTVKRLCADDSVHRSRLMRFAGSSHPTSSETRISPSGRLGTIRQMPLSGHSIFTPPQNFYHSMASALSFVP